MPWSACRGHAPKRFARPVTAVPRRSGTCTTTRATLRSGCTRCVLLVPPPCPASLRAPPPAAAFAPLGTIPRPRWSSVPAPLCPSSLADGHPGQPVQLLQRHWRAAQDHAGGQHPRPQVVQDQRAGGREARPRRQRGGLYRREAGAAAARHGLHGRERQRERLQGGGGGRGCEGQGERRGRLGVDGSTSRGGGSRTRPAALGPWRLGTLHTIAVPTHAAPPTPRPHRPPAALPLPRSLCLPASWWRATRARAPSPATCSPTCSRDPTHRTRRPTGSRWTSAIPRRCSGKCSTRCEDFCPSDTCHDACCYCTVEWVGAWQALPWCAARIPGHRSAARRSSFQEGEGKPRRVAAAHLTRALAFLNSVPPPAQVLLDDPTLPGYQPALPDDFDLDEFAAQVGQPAAALCLWFSAFVTLCMMPLRRRVA